MRIHLVQKARKSPGDCGGCGKEIKAGEQYKWAQGRFTARKLRCGQCAFKASDLTTSKMGAVYDAQDNARDEINSWTGEETEDLSSALQSLAEVVREVAEEYRESVEGIRGTFSESPKADELEEKADNLEGWADELENTQFEELEPKATEEEKQDWIDNQKSEAEGALDSCPE